MSVKDEPWYKHTEILYHSMARPKQCNPRPTKKATAKVAATPESADDYQALADDEENRGGKWRAGDPAKSARAFERAMAIYEQALQRYPDNFDLAYNKARLELEVSQQPALLPHWGLTHGEFLAQTLLSHRKALTINNGDDDVDLLFNTAQVLTSLAEDLSEQQQEQQESNAISLLHEALELLSSCLAKQEILLEQQSVDMSGSIEDDEDDGGVPIATTATDVPSATTAREEEFATIIQPISPNDLLDTVHASLSALTTLTALVDEAALANLDNMARTLVDKKAPSYLALIPSDQQDGSRFGLALDRAAFFCALANARFTAHDIDFRTLVDSLSSFDEIPQKSSRADILVAEADARVEVVLSALEQLEEEEGEVQEVPVMECWRQSSLAQDELTHAAKHNDDTAKDLKAQVYRKKGDVELLRIRIATLPLPAISDTIRNSRTTLLKNSRAFYKGAISHAAPSNDAQTQDIAASRLKAVEFLVDLDNNGQPVLTDDMPELMSDLVDEGLIGAAVMDRISAIQ